MHMWQYNYANSDYLQHYGILGMRFRDLLRGQIKVFSSVFREVIKWQGLL